MRVLYIKVGVVCGKDKAVFKAKFGHVLCCYLVTFYGPVTLALEILDRLELEVWMFCPADSLRILTHAP